MATEERWLRRKAVADLWLCNEKTVPVWADLANVRTLRSPDTPKRAGEIRYLEADVRRVAEEMRSRPKPGPDHGVDPVAD